MRFYRVYRKNNVCNEFYRFKYMFIDVKNLYNVLIL